MPTIAGHQLQEILLKSRNVGRNLAHTQLIASSMIGVSGARVHVLALAQGHGQGPLVCRAEQMVHSAKMPLRRFRLATLLKLKLHQKVASKI